MSSPTPSVTKEISSATSTEASINGNITASNDTNYNNTISAAAATSFSSSSTVSNSDTVSPASAPSSTSTFATSSTQLVAPKLKATAKEFVPTFKIPSIPPTVTTATTTSAAAATTPAVVPPSQQQQQQMPQTAIYPTGVMNYNQMPFIPGQGNPIYPPQQPMMVMQLPNGQLVYSAAQPQYQPQSGMPYYPGGHTQYIPVSSAQQPQQQVVDPTTGLPVVMNMVPYPMTGQVPLQQQPQQVRVGGIPQQQQQGQSQPYIKNKQQQSPQMQNQQQQPRGQYNNPNINNNNNNNSNTRYNNPYTAAVTSATWASGGGLSATAPDFTLGVGAGSRSNSIVDSTVASTSSSVTTSAPVQASTAAVTSNTPSVTEKVINGSTTTGDANGASHINGNATTTATTAPTTAAVTATTSTPAVSPVVESDSWETNIKTLNFNTTAVTGSGVTGASFSFTADEDNHGFQFTGHEDDSATPASAANATSATATTGTPAVILTEPPVFIVDTTATSATVTTNKNSKSRAQSITVDTRFETDQSNDTTTATQPVPLTVTKAVATTPAIVAVTETKQETDKTTATSITTVDKKSSRNTSLNPADAEPSHLANTAAGSNNINFGGNNSNNNNNKQRNDGRSGNNSNNNNNNNNKGGDKDWNRTTSPKPEPSPNSNNNSHSSSQGSSGSGAAVSASATPTVVGSSTPAGGVSSGWRRSETATLPLSVSAMVALKDAITRYDKMSLIRLNKRNKLAPKEIVAIYPFHSQKERFPHLPKGVKDPELIVDESTQEEFQALFKDKENAFKFDPTRLANTEDPEVVMRKANLILNKLSVTNFEKLSDEFMEVGIRTNDDMLNRSVDLLVSKAQMEEHFCFMYADLCKKIIVEWGEEENVADAKSSVPSSGGDGDEDGDTTVAATAVVNADGTTSIVPVEVKIKTLGQNFREKLLERCRDEFEIDRKQELQKVYDMTDTPADIKLEKEILLKKRYNGHMRFIGEIYMKDLVKPKIMKQCLDSLLETGDEESLVCLSKLLRTIGAKLELYDSKKRSKIIQPTMDKIMELCNVKPTSNSTSASAAASSKNKSGANLTATASATASFDGTTSSEPVVPAEPIVLSSRIRFMLKDLIDMWRDGWKARIEETKAKKIGPSGSTNDLDSSSAQGSGGGNNSGSSVNLSAMSSKSTSGGSSSGGGRNDARVGMTGGQTSPKFQDARSMSGRTGSVTVTAPVVVTPPAPVVDEWSTVSTSKKKNSSATATASASVNSGGSGSMSKSISTSDMQSSSSRGNGSSGVSGSNTFSALQGKKKSSSSNSASSKDQSSSASSTKSGSRTVTMSSNSSDSKLSNKYPSSSSLSTSATNNKNSNNNGKNNSNSSNSYVSSNNNSRLNTPSPSLPNNKNSSATTSGDSANYSYDITDDSEMQNEVVSEEVVVDYSQPVEKEVLSSIRGLVDEYYIATDGTMMDELMNDLYIKAPRQRMAEVIKYLINIAMERKQKTDRLKFIDFLIILCSPYTTGSNTSNSDKNATATTATTGTTRAPVISLSELNRGLLLFLNDLDEILLDVPFAATYFATLVASLLLSLKEQKFNLSFLKNIPEENNFSMSMNAHELLGEIFAVLVEKLKVEEDGNADTGTADSDKGLVKSTSTATGAETNDGSNNSSNQVMEQAAVIFIAEGGVDLVQSLPHDPHSPETLTEVMSRVADKFILPFLKVTV